MFLFTISSLILTAPYNGLFRKYIRNELLSNKKFNGFIINKLNTNTKYISSFKNTILPSNKHLAYKLNIKSNSFNDFQINGLRMNNYNIFNLIDIDFMKYKKLEINDNIQIKQILKELNIKSFDTKKLINTKNNLTLSYSHLSNSNELYLLTNGIEQYLSDNKYKLTDKYYPFDNEFVNFCVSLSVWIDILITNIFLFQLYF